MRWTLKSDTEKKFWEKTGCLKARIGDTLNDKKHSN